MLFFFIATLLQPNDTLTGRVVDVGGQPVAAAIVEITELGRSVTTTEAGAFRIAIAPGRYTLAVRRHGFAPVVREIVVARGQAALEIVLTPSALRLEPVTVTASRQPLAVQTSPLPASAGRLAGACRRGAAGRAHPQHRRANREAGDSRLLRPARAGARERQPARGLLVE